MDAWGVWLVAIGVIVAGASAAFAWVQAHSAVESLKEAREARDAARESAAESARLASEANAAFIRQATAQEEANRLHREAMTPDDWEVGQVGENSFRATNASKGTLHVIAYDVKPEEVRGLVPLSRVHDDGVYEYGDSFTFAVVRGFGVSPEKLTIRYRRDDDAEDDWRSFHLSL